MFLHHAIDRRKFTTQCVSARFHAKIICIFYAIKITKCTLCDTVNLEQKIHIRIIWHLIWRKWLSYPGCFFFVTWIIYAYRFTHLIYTLNNYLQEKYITLLLLRRKLEFKFLARLSFVISECFAFVSINYYKLLTFNSRFLSIWLCFSQIECVKLQIIS